MSDDSYRSLRERLQSKAKRPLDRTREPIASAPATPLSLTRPHELSAMAVGLLVLKHVEATGRTRLHEQAIQDSLKRITEHLSAAQMMRLEVEAFEIVDWLVGDGEELVGPRPAARFIAEVRDDGVHYDPSSSIAEIVREAARQQFDLKINYFSARRMEMNTRVISPKAIAAEIYVRAWCHERRDERIFRMDRIRSAVPIDGKAQRNPYLERVLSEERHVQQSLEFEHLSFSEAHTDAVPLRTEAPKPTPTHEGPAPWVEPTAPPPGEDATTPGDAPTIDEAPEPVEAPAPVEAPESVEAPEPVEAPAPEATPEPVEAPEPVGAPEPVEAPEPEDDDADDDNQMSFF